MSIADLDKVDAMGVSPDGKELCMLITDHLPWDDEYIHLDILQDKLNAYLAHLENGEWKNSYPGKYERITIEIHFLYEITPNCEKFLQAVQDQLGQYGIRIKAVIADEETRQKTMEAVAPPKKNSGFPS